MKKKLLLLTITLLFIGLKMNVHALTYTDQFYIAEVIDGIYYAKEKDGEIEYRKAKFKRRSDDKSIVYCIEPFVDIKEDTNYKGYDYDYEKLLNLSKEDWERITLLSYYGYGYDGHTEEKWYPITQLLIWETIDKNAKFYYTNTYKGDKITRFTSEIKELNRLVENHKKIPSFSNEKIEISIDSTIILEDFNQVLNEYEVENYQDLDIEKNDNQLVVTTKNEEKNIEIKLIKKDKKHQNYPIIYVSETYQNILTIGKYETIETQFNIVIGSGSLEITKKDFETNSYIPQGEAQIKGTTYALYDIKNSLIKEIVIDENGKGQLEKLKYGDYKLIEIKSGLGYILDPNEYYFSINNENNSIKLDLTNEVIKSKVKLMKYKKEDEILTPEKNIKFQILNSKNEIYKEVETDINGYIEIELPYGTYLVKQINTSDGFYKVDDFEIKIDESTPNEIEFYLHDLKIPDTNEESNYKYLIMMFLTTIGLYTITLKYD